MNATSYELYLKHGPTPGTIYPLADKGLTVGRDPLSDILINDPEVSRQHALLSRTPTGDFRIQDLGSTNGTYVDGKRLGSEPMILQPSNAITMGGTVTLVFRERSKSERATLEQGRDKDSPGSAQPVVKDNRPVEKEVKKPGKQPIRSLEAAAKLEPSDQPKHQPVVYSTGEEIPKPTRIETGPSAELSPNLILGIILLLLCGCASVLVFLVYLGGDWILREIGLVP